MPARGERRRRCEGSLLLLRNDVREHLDPYEPGGLGYPWRSAERDTKRRSGDRHARSIPELRVID
jgi:hypothetical protein